MNVAILGASPDPERYSNRAMHDLEKWGHKVFLVNPKYPTIEGKTVYPSLSKISEAIDTITVYVGPKLITTHIPLILGTKPRRVIMNPGAESEELKTALEKAGIEAIEACTLVMLRTKTF